MMFCKQHILIAIGPIVMGMSLGTFAMDYYCQEFLAIFRALQVLATISLLFGVLKKEPLHKDKFLVFWLIITAIFFGVMCYYCMNFITDDFLYSFYDFGEFLLALLVLLLLLAATAFLGYLIYYVYEEYARLRTANSESTAVAASERNAVVETKEPPPTYESTGNLTVSIQN
ncbi:uncharacterized protein Dvir_GJ19925 [Drosophila virilis]|uniref:Uncharacterized protein n=1 Tax=Drosophila virilis TaxID=7244 RepID=B4LN09_DROVI|nr:uncharacterized protein LOC6626672 [Drosophila virilis]EDW62124.2 uncharacterized protein Dvir_GJ19925 [Drosophila virilis]